MEFIPVFAQYFKEEYKGKLVYDGDKFWSFRNKWNIMDASIFSDIIKDEIIMFRNSELMIKSMNNKFFKEIKFFIKNSITNHEFIKKMNTNNNLLCFGKYTYDLSKHDWKISEASDYCTLSTGYDKNSVNDEFLKGVLKFFDDYFDDKSFEVLKKITSLIFKNNKKLTIFQGNRGNNGKDTFIKFLSKSLGQYFVVGPTDIILGRFTRIDKSYMKGCKICKINEPDSLDEISSIQIKRLVYENINFIMPSNDLVIEKDDVVDIIEFKNIFKFNPDRKKKNEKQRYVLNEMELERLRGSLMYVLLTTHEIMQCGDKFYPDKFKYSKYKNEILTLLIVNNRMKQRLPTEMLFYIFDFLYEETPKWFTELSKTRT